MQTDTSFEAVEKHESAREKSWANFAKRASGKELHFDLAICH